MDVTDDAEKIPLRERDRVRGEISRMDSRNSIPDALRRWTRGRRRNGVAKMVAGSVKVTQSPTAMP